MPGGEREAVDAVEVGRGARARGRDCDGRADERLAGLGVEQGAGERAALRVRGRRGEQDGERERAQPAGRAPGAPEGVNRHGREGSGASARPWEPCHRTDGEVRVPVGRKATGRVLRHRVRAVTAAWSLPLRAALPGRARRRELPGAGPPPGAGPRARRHAESPVPPARRRTWMPTLRVPLPTSPLRTAGTLFALWLMVFTAASQTIIVTPILPLIAAELGVAVGPAGPLVSVYSVVLAAAALVMGPVSDRIGRKRVMVLGSGVLAVVLAGHGLADTYPRAARGARARRGRRRDALGRGRELRRRRVPVRAPRLGDGLGDVRRAVRARARHPGRAHPRGRARASARRSWPSPS